MSNLIGRTLLNRYRVDSYIASGGMSVVYKVWDTQRNTWLAMKVLHLDLADDPTVLKRFEREARALQKLTHPHIVSFYGLYQEEDFFFLLEQYVGGPTLKQILKQNNRPLSIEDTLSILKAICTALSYAHNNDVVHCDIKPGNVMVDAGGNIFLADFGVARHAESTTTTIGSAGTPAYMAPEQIRGEAVSPATDVYALGVMLFEMLTGQRPFLGVETSGGATAAERVRAAHLTLPPPDPRSINSAISAALSNVVLTALTKDPRQRYQTAIEMFEQTCIAAEFDPAKIPDRIAPPEIHRLDPPTEKAIPKKHFWQIWAILAALIILASAGYILNSPLIIQPTGIEQIQNPHSIESQESPDVHLTDIEQTLKANLTATSQASIAQSTATAQEIIVRATATRAAIKEPFTGAREWRLLLQDSFDNNQTGWNIGDVKNDFWSGAKEIANGKYIWRVESKQEGFIDVELYTLEKLDNFFVSTDARCTQGSDASLCYGLWFRLSEKGSYIFEVCNNQTFQVRLLTLPNISESLIDWTQSDAIQVGKTNNIAVAAVGDHYQFFINRQLVTSMVNNKLDRGLVGILISLYSNSELQAQYEFDNFLILAP